MAERSRRTPSTVRAAASFATSRVADHLGNHRWVSARWVRPVSLKSAAIRLLSRWYCAAWESVGASAQRLRKIDRWRGVFMVLEFMAWPSPPTTAPWPGSGRFAAAGGLDRREGAAQSQPSLQDRFVPDSDVKKV